MILKQLSRYQHFSKILVCNNESRLLSTSATVCEIQKMTRLRVVDNSPIGKQAMAEGKPPKCIQVYNKKGIGKIGSSNFI